MMHSFRSVSIRSKVKICRSNYGVYTRRCDIDTLDDAGIETRYYSQARNCGKIPLVPQPEKPPSIRQETPWESSLKRLTVSGCELRYLRFGAGRPLVLAHTLRTQLDYFLPVIRLLGQ